MSGSALLPLATAAAAWSSARRVAVGTLRVRYREAGHGFPLVLVHGLGVSADYWFRNGPTLAAQGFRVLAPDLPGFGRTPGPTAGLDVPGQAEALAKWAEALELGPAVFVGHSLAAQSVLMLAAHYPGLTRGLVLEGPTGDASGNPLLRQIIGLLRDIPREPLSLVPPVAQAYLRAGVPRIWRTWKAGAGQSPLPLLSSVRCPGLIVVGVRDPVVSRAYAEALAGGIPQGRVAWIPGAAHAVHFGEPDRFNRLVASFSRKLAECSTSAPPMPTRAAGSSARDGR